MQKDLVAKFQELKSRQSELTAEKLKYETKLEQLSNEMKQIQDKYPEYDLSSVESVELIIKNLESQLDKELEDINKRYMMIKGA